MKEQTEAISVGFGSRLATKGEATTLNVVALYDGFMTAVYAHEAVGSLTMAVRSYASVASYQWNFDMLARLDVRHPSIRVAAEADVIIVAADSSSPLPAHVRSWLTRSLQENGKGAPVIVAIHQEESEQEQITPPLLADLGPIADQWNTRLLCNGEFDTFLEQDVATEFADGKRTNTLGLDFGSRFSSPHPAWRWGINE